MWSPAERARRNVAVPFTGPGRQPAVRGFFMHSQLAAILLFLPVAFGVWCVGGRREWSLLLLTQTLLWSGVALHLLFLFRLYRERRYSSGNGHQVSWREPLIAWAVALPWIAAILIGWKGTYNPAFIPLDNTLLSPLLPLAHNESLPTTVNPIRSRHFLSFYAAVTVFAVGGWLTLRTRRSIRLLLILLFANGALLTVLGTAAKVFGSEKMLWLLESHTRSFFATIYYKNHWGGLVILWLGVGMALTVDGWQRARARGQVPELSIACLILMFPMVLSLVLAQARASFFVALLLILIFTAAVFRVRAKPRNRAFVLGAALTVTVGALASLWWIAAPQAERMYERSERQFSWLLTEEPMPPDARLAAYHSTLSVVAERPLWGWGAGSFPYIFPLHAEDSLIQADGKPLFFEFAHNDYLQLPAEHGLAGGMLIIIPPILALVLARRYHRSRLATWTFVGLGGLLLLAAVDFPFGNPSVTATFWLLAVAALGHCRMSTTKNPDAPPRNDRTRSASPG